MLEGDDPNAMLGVMKVLRIMLLRSKLFYCLRLPIHPMLEGGDPNAMLGVSYYPKVPNPHLGPGLEGRWGQSHRHHSIIKKGCCWPFQVKVAMLAL